SVRANSISAILTLAAPGQPGSLSVDHAIVIVGGTSHSTDAGFETPVQGSGSTHYTYGPPGSAWAFSGLAGLSGNGTILTSGNPNAPQGAQVAFLEQNGSFSQSVNFATGRYVVTFSAAQRQNFQAKGPQTINV